ncbi:hypothetical protein K474DRAFT_1654465 [Panus rudis PR-1116 ss-1]|nr:hypothetical protein K474DRAFT_1654465 [Panus rudis PR-1116 ss-1]
MRYKNSLIGKHFKVLQQVAVFHLHDLFSTDSEIFQLWKATGELGAMLWYPEVAAADMDLYLHDLKVLIDNLLDVWAVLDPERILTKMKIHILPHVIEDIPLFGPALLHSTEIYESWNHVFRLCSTFSNHLAPSRDIAGTILDMSRFKHQVSGGWWKDCDGRYVQAGVKVRSFLQESNPKLRARLGWSAAEDAIPGSVKTLPAARQVNVTAMTWAAGVHPLSCVEPTLRQPNSETLVNGIQWVPCKSVVAKSGDRCQVGSWVFYRPSTCESPTTNNLRSSTEMPGTVQAARVHSILQPQDKIFARRLSTERIIVQCFDILATADEVYNMPVLMPSALSPGSSVNSVALLPEDILFIFNAQHDCRSSRCAPSGRVRVTQERRETELTQAVIEHANIERWLLNMHALHNSHLIRRVLPRSLWAPKHYLQNRSERHKEIAAALRISRPQKRAATAAKRAETMRRKKADKPAPANSAPQAEA